MSCKKKAQRSRAYRRRFNGNELTVGCCWCTRGVDADIFSVKPYRPAGILGRELMCTIEGAFQ
jgi:hypothetical protein